MNKLIYRNTFLLRSSKYKQLCYGMNFLVGGVWLTGYWLGKLNVDLKV